MRIVIDTNVIASAVFFGGRPKELLELLLNGRLEAFASTEIVVEYKETLEELCARYPNRPEKLPLIAIVSAMKIIEPSSRIAVCRDPDDDKFIECADDAKCVYIVSGDKDLLSLKKYKDIEIVTVADFMAAWGNGFE
jgi:putative PIN family toxin of toxin-antitoxin system